MPGASAEPIGAENVATTSRSLRGVALLGGAAVVVTVVLALLLASLMGYLGPDRHSAAAPAAGAPTDAEVTSAMQVLTSHAAALAARDQARWDATIDPSVNAAVFRAQEQRAYLALAALPLTTWRFTLTAPVTDPAVISAADARLEGRAVILHVQLHYGISEIDPQPTSHDQWLTFVQRGGQYLLAGDEDVAGAGGQSWQGPWDFGLLTVVRTAHTVTIAHPDRAGDARTYADLVETSVPVVTAVWGRDWNQHVGVLIPDTAAEFAAVTADSNDTSDLAAVSIADAVQSDGVVLGARIVLNPTNLERLDAAGRRLVVQHELTHIAARAVTSDQMPTWVIEGFADYVGNLDSGQSEQRAASELATEIRRGTVPAALPTNADFDGANPRLAQVYEESWLACRLIAAKVGQRGLVDFYHRVATAANLDPDTAVASVLRSELRESVAAFTQQWQAALRSALG